MKLPFLTDNQTRFSIFPLQFHYIQRSHASAFGCMRDQCRTCSDQICNSQYLRHYKHPNGLIVTNNMICWKNWATSFSWRWSMPFFSVKAEASWQLFLGSRRWHSWHNSQKVVQYRFHFQTRWGYRGKSAPVNSKIWEYADLSTFRGASATWRFLTLRSIGEQPMLAVCWNPWIDGGWFIPPQQKKGLECHHHLLLYQTLSRNLNLCFGFETWKPKNHCVKSEYSVI